MQFEYLITEEFGMTKRHSRMFIGSFQRQPEPIWQFASRLSVIQNTYQQFS
jgi:hypothetical protein